MALESVVQPCAVYFKAIFLFLLLLLFSSEQSLSRSPRSLEVKSYMYGFDSSRDVRLVLRVGNCRFYVSQGTKTRFIFLV